MDPEQLSLVDEKNQIVQAIKSLIESKRNLLLWQKTPEGEKLVHTIESTSLFWDGKLTIAIDKTSHPFKPSSDLLFFQEDILFVFKASIEKIYDDRIILNTPTSIRVNDERKTKRIYLYDKSIKVIFSREVSGKGHQKRTAQLFDISQTGLGLICKSEKMNELNPPQEIKIISIGPQNFTPPLIAQLVHTNTYESLPKLGLKLSKALTNKEIAEMIFTFTS